MKNPYDIQKGGKHYTDMGYQPSQLAFDCGAPASFQCIAKYLTRDKIGQAKELDLKKALHFVQIEDFECNHRNSTNWLYYNVSGFSLNSCISGFSSQFKEGDIIFDVLMNLTQGLYKDAEQGIQFLITTLPTDKE